MAYAKFQINRLKIGGEIAENHAILVTGNLTASITLKMQITVIALFQLFLHLFCRLIPRALTSPTVAILRFINKTCITRLQKGKVSSNCDIKKLCDVNLTNPSNF